jgi:hypothetical protein
MTTWNLSFFAEYVFAMLASSAVYDLTLARRGQIYTLPTGTTFWVNIPLFNFS